MARLAQAEAHEPDVWRKDDLRQAFIVVSLAVAGNPAPFVEACYRCYGVHPEKLFAHITARRRADLGADYDRWYDAAGNPRVDAPKKPSESTPRHAAKKADRR